ncbi:unnamed protein product [Ceutorhynchus assimilis]|uniref:Uncharacterized protein n=1 Tax=Ceutorhynchus assimilis TaxID=467358 RepID=A0A9N9MIU8_9CUCU|nr:unnamed protein product [Ceutorhynchus assimilis]
MADSISPRHLLVSEIDYELKFRGVLANCGRPEKITLLKRLLDKVAQGGNQSNVGVYKFTFAFPTESIEIDTTIASITTLVADFEGNPSDTLFLKIKTRLAHVMARIQRLIVPEDDTKDEEI